ncbi:hypothetical protein [Fusobacterium polymorphum]
MSKIFVYCASNKEMTPTDIIVAPIFNANFIPSFKFEIVLSNTEADFTKF